MSSAPLQSKTLGGEPVSTDCSHGGVYNVLIHWMNDLPKPNFCNVTSDKVINYKENYDKYSKTKNKELLKAIKCANSIMNHPNNIKSNDESTTPKIKVKKIDNCYLNEDKDSLKYNNPIKEISLDDAINCINKVANENVELTDCYLSQTIISSAETIQKKLKNHILIPNKRIGANLIKIRNKCKFVPALEEAIRSINETLERLKELIMEVYFEQKEDPMSEISLKPISDSVKEFEFDSVIEKNYLYEENISEDKLLVEQDISTHQKMTTENISNIYARTESDIGNVL